MVGRRITTAKRQLREGLCLDELAALREEGLISGQEVFGIVYEVVGNDPESADTIYALLRSHPSVELRSIPDEIEDLRTRSQG